MTISRTSMGFYISDVQDSSLRTQPSMTEEEQRRRLVSLANTRGKSVRDSSVYFTDTSKYGKFYVDEKGWCVFTYSRAEKIAEDFNSRGIKCYIGKA